MDTPMERKQVYLGPRQITSLDLLGDMTGDNMSEIIRQAIDDYAERQLNDRKKRKEHVRSVLKRVAGIWKDRDPKEFEEIRRSADRRLDEWGV